MNTLYSVVAERAVYRCEYCHAPEAVFNFPFEAEHILPQARGGSDDLDNLVLACHACNLFKSDFETGRDEVSRVTTNTAGSRLLVEPGGIVPEQLLSRLSFEARPAKNVVDGMRKAALRVWIIRGVHQHIVP